MKTTVIIPLKGTGTRALDIKVIDGPSLAVNAVGDHVRRAFIVAFQAHQRAGFGGCRRRSGAALLRLATFVDVSPLPPVPAGLLTVLVDNKRVIFGAKASNVQKGPFFLAIAKYRRVGGLLEHIRRWVVLALDALGRARGRSRWDVGGT